MESVTRVQILDEVVCVSIHANANRKELINVFPQIGINSCLCKATDLCELGIQNQPYSANKLTLCCILPEAKGLGGCIHLIICFIIFTIKRQPVGTQFDLVSLFNVISTFVYYLMSKPCL